jgi:hypothetical protein
MDYQRRLAPVIGDAVEKSLKALGKGDQEIKDSRSKVEYTFLTDGTINATIDGLINEELKKVDVGRFPGLRAAVRPVVTILLALVFGFLIIFPFVWEVNPFLVNWDKIFASFMGVFGTIIGFWFGERSALKVPGAEPKPVTKPSPPSGAPAGPETSTGPEKQTNHSDQ